MLLDYRRISWWNVSYVSVDDTFGKRTLFEGHHTIWSIGFQLQLLGQESKSLYKKICKRYRWVMFTIYYFSAFKHELRLDLGTTGKYLSDTLILASTNPQYDDRLFTELRVKYKKIARSEHVVYTKLFLF